MLQLPGPAIGPTNVKLVVSYTGDSGVKKTIEKIRTVWAVPVWLIVAFGVGLLVLLLAGVWAVSGRAAKRRMDRDADGRRYRTTVRCGRRHGVRGVVRRDRQVRQREVAPACSAGATCLDRRYRVRVYGSAV